MFLEKQIKLKYAENSSNLFEISILKCFFLGSMILHKSSTIAFTDTHSFGLVWPRIMNNIPIES